MSNGMKAILQYLPRPAQGSSMESIES